MNLVRTLKFCSEFKKYTNASFPDKELIIFPEQPFWFIATKNCYSFLNTLDNATSEHISTLPISEQSIVKFLLQNNLVSFNDLPRSKNPFSEKKIHPLLGVWVNIDSACNLNCKHCFLGEKEQTNPKDFLSPSEYHKIALDLLRVKGSQPVKVDITGGEPLLRKDILDIVKAFEVDGIRINIITNGLLLTDVLIHKLSKMNLEITISLDGINKEQHEFIRGKNTFDATIRNIKKCTSAGIPTTITMTVHKKNQDSILQYFDLAEELNVSHVNLSYLNDFGNAPIFGLELANEFECTKKLLLEATTNPKIYSKLMDTAIGTHIETLLLPIYTDCCGSGINNCSIGADGTVYPCPSFQDSIFIGGNLKEKSIVEIWCSSETFPDHRNVNVLNMNPTCSKCDVRLFCGGGCRAQAYFTNQENLHARSSKCIDYKQIIFETMWLLHEHPVLSEIQTSEGIPFRSKAGENNE